MKELNINKLTQGKANTTANHLTDFCGLFVQSNLVNIKPAERACVALLLTCSNAYKQTKKFL